MQGWCLAVESVRIAAGGFSRRLAIFPTAGVSRGPTTFSAVSRAPFRKAQNSNRPLNFSDFYCEFCCGTKTNRFSQMAKQNCLSARENEYPQSAVFATDAVMKEHCFVWDKVWFCYWHKMVWYRRDIGASLFISKYFGNETKPNFTKKGA